MTDEMDAELKLIQELCEALRMSVAALQDNNVDEALAGEFEIITDAFVAAQQYLLAAERSPNPEELVLACANCGSVKVQAQSWTDANTDEVLSDAGGYRWCDNCEERTGNGELSENWGFVQIPRKDTKEWKDAQVHSSGPRTTAAPDDLL